MAKQYQWRATTQYATDTNLSYGVTPADYQTWQNADVGTTRSGTWQYWYRDSNTEVAPGVWSDSISSRVVLSVTQSWDVSVDNRNYMTVRIDTTINSIVRDDVRGSDLNTPGRVITIYEYEGGPSRLSVSDNLIATAHTIYSGPLVLQPETFVLPPGENAYRATLFLHSIAPGWPTYDKIWFGVQIRNPLPKDYRPGAVLETDNGSWFSHNRTGGKCHILTADNGAWAEMRTQGGDNGEKGNPPSVLRADNGEWFNQRLIGKE